jgi:hypothetical protein
MRAERDRLKETTLGVLDQLPQDRVAEVLDFALFVKQRGGREVGAPRDRIAPSAPAAHLDGLVGLVAWGGDALADTECLYDGNG